MHLMLQIHLLFETGDLVTLCKTFEHVWKNNDAAYFLLVSLNSYQADEKKNE